MSPVYALFAIARRLWLRISEKTLFISSGPEDDEIARTLSAALVGQFRILLGCELRQVEGAIQKGIDKADYFVYMIAPQSVLDTSVARYELELAERKWPLPQGRLISVVIEPTSPNDIPAYARAVGMFYPGHDIPGETAQVIAGLRRWRKPSARTIFSYAARVCVGAIIVTFLAVFSSSKHAASEDTQWLNNKMKVLGTFEDDNGDEVFHITMHNFSIHGCQLSFSQRVVEKRKNTAEFSNRIELDIDMRHLMSPTYDSHGYQAKPSEPRYFPSIILASATGPLNGKETSDEGVAQRYQRSEVALGFADESRAHEAFPRLMHVIRYCHGSIAV